MAIPTIYTLAEDAINNIPKHLKEASLAVGATPLQTTFRVIVPSALSGIISAIMLGAQKGGEQALSKTRRDIAKIKREEEKEREERGVKRVEEQQPGMYL